MINNLRKLVAKNLSGKRVLLLFIVTNLVYAFMLVITIPKTMTFSDGMKLFDMMPFGYNSEYVNTLLDTLGERGREAYLYNQIPVDMIYPFLYGISYCLLIAYFLKKIDKLNSGLFYLCLLPLIGGLADYLENFGIITMLNGYPNISSTQSMLTNAFTIVKSATTTVYFLALIIILILLGIRAIKAKTSVSDV